MGEYEMNFRVDVEGEPVDVQVTKNGENFRLMVPRKRWKWIVNNFQIILTRLS
jgi:hypothetical protein